VYEPLINYLEEEAKRLKAKDIRSIKSDHAKLKDILDKRNAASDKLDENVNSGKVLEIFKDGQMIRECA
jgi:hypothetical protein